MSNYKSWPFLEALKLKRNLEKNNSLSIKKIINFETGYGPSGVPHIGTFAEVLRTNMVKNAFEHLYNLETNLIAFSDDFDALRKVPDDYPFPEKLKKELNKPLSMIPDFTEQYKSYADRNNGLLKNFLDKFGFKYNFLSSTENYKSGKFDQQLLMILRNYENIMNIVLPTLRKERRETYSPFLPLCQKTGVILQVPLKILDKEKGIVAYKDSNNKYIETLVTGGNCKLQWKVDWAMRWSALSIDYEMNGKDLIPSFELSSKIAEFIEKKIPVNMKYELFLDENGEKISKSRGNGLSIEEWLKYGSEESLSVFMFNNPQRAKRLYFDCIPKSMDEYRSNMMKIKNNENNLVYDNPLWHIHSGDIPEHISPLDFSSLLNLVTALNTDQKTTIIEFVKIYIKDDLNIEIEKALEESIIYALAYFKRFIFPNLNKLRPNNQQIKLIKNIILDLETHEGVPEAEDYQKIIYNRGKEIYNDNLRECFLSLYKILFGSNSGPRLGSYFYIHGLDKTLNILKDVLKE